LSEDNFVYLFRGKLGALQGGLDRGAAEIMGRHTGKNPIESADRRAGRSYDDDRRHSINGLSPALNSIC
jgi:hypothetical protein